MLDANQVPACITMTRRQRSANPAVSRLCVGGNGLGAATLVLPFPGDHITGIAQQCLQLAVVRQNLLDLGSADDVCRVLATHQWLA